MRRPARRAPPTYRYRYCIALSLEAEPRDEGPISNPLARRACVCAANARVCGALDRAPCLRSRGMGDARSRYRDVDPRRGGEPRPLRALCFAAAASRRANARFSWVRKRARRSPGALAFGGYLLTMGAAGLQVRCHPLNVRRTSCSAGMVRRVGLQRAGVPPAFWSFFLPSNTGSPTWTAALFGTEDVRTLAPSAARCPAQSNGTRHGEIEALRRSGGKRQVRPPRSPSPSPPPLSSRSSRAPSLRNRVTRRSAHAAIGRRGGAGRGVAAALPEECGRDHERRVSEGGCRKRSRCHPTCRRTSTTLTPARPWTSH